MDEEENEEVVEEEKRERVEGEEGMGEALREYQRVWGVGSGAEKGNKERGKRGKSRLSSRKKSEEKVN